MKENKGNRLTLTEIKQVELGILDYIVDICNKYNLIYYLSYGTLIGAIRHKGFIPWDDDIDISMPRDDYEKFLKITSSGQINSKYKCLVPLVDGYYYEFAKVIDTSTIVEDVSVQSTENGVWVDIFPLDGLKKSDKISHLSLITFVFNLWSTPYNAALIAHERMGAFAYIGIFEGLANLLIAFMVLYSFCM